MSESPLAEPPVDTEPIGDSGEFEPGTASGDQPALERPPIDENRPERVETATFALG